MLDAIDGIAKKVVDGRTIALGCSCPLDGGACHRNILRRAILQAAERKRREIDPTLTMLRECVLEADVDKATDP